MIRRVPEHADRKAPGAEAARRTGGRTRRKRFQTGSLQKRKVGKTWKWTLFWWENGCRRGKTLGSAAHMTRSEALAAASATLLPVNETAGRPIPRTWTVKELIEDSYIPYCRRKWKQSTAGTTIDRIRFHLVGELGKVDIRSVTRDLLQRFIERKAAGGLSHSVTHHLRWDLRAIFRHAVGEGLLPSNPGEHLFTPGTPGPRSRRVLTPDQVRTILGVLDLREQLVVRLAIYSGMRPGEITALQWTHVHADHVEVAQRVYRGKIDRPKTARSTRLVALSPETRITFQQWRENTFSGDPYSWVLPSENLTTPVWRDNLWRRAIEPRLHQVDLSWVNFQVMRRTHATLSRQAGIDPKLVAEQLGHGLGVNLDVYTVAGLDQRLAAVGTLEEKLSSPMPS